MAADERTTPAGDEREKSDALYQVAELRRRRLATLVHVTGRLVAGLDLPTTLASIAEAAAALFEGEAGFRLLEGDELVRVGATPAARQAMARERLRLGESLSGHVAATGVPVTTTDTASDERLIPEHRAAIDPGRTGAVMCVPVRMGTRLLGTLHIYREQGYKFDDDAIELALTFADQAAIALENARLHAETEERLRESEVLRAVGHTLSLDLPTPEAIRRVCREMARAFHADMVGAYFLDEAKQLLVPMAGYHVPKHLLPAFLETPLRTAWFSSLEDAWRTQKPVWSLDAMTDPRVDATVQERFQPRAVLFAPTPVRGEIVGGIFLVWWTPGRTFTPAELRWAEAVATQVGLALERAELVRRTEARREMQFGVTRILAESVTLADAAPRLLRAICEGVGWEMGELWQVDETGGRLRWVELWHVSALDAAEFRAVSREGSCGPGERLPGRVWATGEPVWVPDAVAADPCLRTAAAVRLGLRGAVGLPIRGVRDVTGVLVFFSRRPHKPADDLLGLAADLGAQVGQFLERTRATTALAESEQRFRTFAEAAFEGIGLSEQGRILDVNRQLAAISGYTRDELIGRDIIDLVAPDDRELVAGNIRSGYDKPYEHRVVRKDGSIRDVEVRGHAVGYRGRTVRVTAVHDVTERKRAEAALAERTAELRRAEKSEALIRFASGVTHYFNNLLTVIEGRSALALRRLAPEDPVRGSLETIRRAAERAAALTRRFLAFAQKQALRATELDLNALVMSKEPALRRLLGEGVEMVFDLASGPLPVQADAEQLAFCLGNLVENGQEAMAQGGRLTIETRNVELDAAFVREHPGATPGPHVRLAVSDSGVGMSAEAQAHLFEPFFSTKGPGQGRGLGLAAAYGIVKQHRGYVEVESEPGRGTTVRLYLPRVEASAAALPAAERLPRGSGTILVVDDEDEIRGLMREVLEADGYRVIEARSGPEALAVADRYRDPLDMLLTDVVMPHMNGPELAAQLGAGRPGLRVLYVSGYVGEAPCAEVVLEPGTPFLLKPFGPEELTRAVRRVLETPPTGGG